MASTPNAEIPNFDSLLIPALFAERVPHVPSQYTAAGTMATQTHLMRTAHAFTRTIDGRE